MTNEYFPLHIWLQPIDDYGVEIGEPKQSFNLELVHAQSGDYIKNPRYVDESIDPHLEGEWVIQEREFTEHKGSVDTPTPRNLTLYLRSR